LWLLCIFSYDWEFKKEVANIEQKYSLPIKLFISPAFLIQVNWLSKLGLGNDMTFMCLGRGGWVQAAASSTIQISKQI
jgi:hypothetical protein